ncbi:MAG: tRNA (adenosine(37)-N6)-threonylcarbamoyltransferase complex dimerization subunit type 1 TsaB [Marinobacter sp.]|uniref:tRNA (adenosine(37)-N6)-threonylcarbamoyltransferase complex dimerization subunit type 1 TsaB n=1 Tax=Marinobacter sp. TaxID=50741 RepID=UPI00299DAD4E|nr:tRNA (adenosine(37)-N6)-threonylcarbamoyltransferase complex dimerization subunit type 1 TsaB [Marinobacter sp.]MDX1754495.1 tRNA (adenosine(37)-N6)-threonylcarbamoyltransferase complex dimerization subunit type 1 TsaB [Marinobacter sp.]
MSQSNLKLLALDTSSEGCSAALLVDGQLYDRFELAPRGHTRLLMPMIRQLLADQQLQASDLDALAFACGPGSFTGLRIATGVVQGLAYGLDVPVVPVSSLAAVAADALASPAIAVGHGVAVAFDARMGEVYWGCFEDRDGLPVAVADERVCAPELVSLPNQPEGWCGVGSGLGYRDQMPDAVISRLQGIDENLVPSARHVARLAAEAYRQGRAVPAAQAQPVYLRNTVAWKKLPGR